MKDPWLRCFQFICGIAVLAAVTVADDVKGHLQERLHYFETLKHVDVKASGRQKRSADGSHIQVKDVSFSAFGRNFNLVLTPGSPVLSADLTAKLVYGDGRSLPLHINDNQFFTGHLAEKESVKADAHTEDGLWTASIYEKDDIYILEPSSGHLPPSDNHSMIVYKQSDIKWENIFPDLASKPGQKQTICNSLHAEDEADYDQDWERKDDGHLDLDLNHTSSRSKRASSPSRNMCHIIAVADYTFYNGPGGGFPHQTANYVIQTLQKVNRIFSNTVWSKTHGLYNMGLQIKELRVHPEPTDASRYNKGLHYNMKLGSWPDQDLLRQFGEDATLHEFCLAHLFTYRQFAGGVLGLAYIAPPRKYALGGICSNSRARRAMNTGFSTTMNTKGNNLLTQEAVLVTTHEFGHNWGAEHDAETKECAPNSYNNGKYLMYPYAVNGFEDNNYFFSPCSKRYITSALITRSSQCFKKLTAKVPMCGNGIVDKGETCDGGSIGLTNADPCCSKECKFKGNAVCSPSNSECCYNCQMAPSGTICRGQNQDLCQKEAKCIGTRLECPDSKHFDNGTECIDKGECFAGRCLDFCHVQGIKIGKNLKPCQCDQDRISACKRCCKSVDEELEADSVCKPYGGNLQNGRPCGYGYCVDGYCKTGRGNMIKRLFSFIENLDSSTLVAFMKANIVGTIIVISLVIWIPVSWVISYIDKRPDKKKSDKDLCPSQRPHFANIDDPKITKLVGPLKFDHRNRPYWSGQTPGAANDGGGRYEGGDDGSGGENRGSNGMQETTYNPQGKGDGPMEIESVV